MADADISTEEVRGAVVLAMEGFWHPDAGSDFDRWLAGVKAEVWAEAARIARTYDQGYDPTPASIAEEFDSYANEQASSRAGDS